MKMWIAREPDNALTLHSRKPTLFKEDTLIYWTGGYCLYLPHECFPEVTFENSPMEVELVIKK